MRILFVGGDFNGDGGRPSGYIRKLAEAIEACVDGPKPVLLNGGSFAKLQAVLEGSHPDVAPLTSFDVIMWFANVPNHEDKLVRSIKELHPTCMLVTSKNNIEGKYSVMELVSRALQNKANLLVEFRRAHDTVAATVMDPLCNVFCLNETRVGDLARIIVSRVRDLARFTRIGSRQIAAEAIPAPGQEDFFALVSTFALTFHELIHPANTTRFLGNASFRCENGFPSMRTADGKIFVSRRNLDKRELGAAGFVAVEPELKEGAVQYHGPLKPSVDTPVQLSLYRYYGNINYIVHSHVYVKDAPFTHRMVPCGAIEEVAEVTTAFPWPESERFAINLLGHGSLILSCNVDGLKGYEFVARPVPEDLTGQIKCG